ncbi:hypothetical protein Baya_5401 [Bagarius yarrelli]|uniref:Uncharacterized protein n=1 Tax=Bagarius yarrelli TaxID=175774 RepID=A0A556TWN5_BAGYA|nr:hypothetical protein Baya_5401 [Bagarius yarrelli]
MKARRSSFNIVPCIRAARMSEQGHAFLWLSCKLKTLAVSLSHHTLQKWTSFVRMNFPSPLTCEALIIQHGPLTEGRSIMTIAERAPSNDTDTLLPSQI